MHVTRRNLAIAGALAFGSASLVGSFGALADASDAAAVRNQVEVLRKALLAADKADLQKLTADQLSYGHSDGRVQNKTQFIDGVLTRKAVIKSLTFPDLSIALAGDAAIVRHTFASESESGGKTSNIRLSVLCVWQKQDGDWKLLARQGYKPA
ncbi:MAG: nuclear transport factor 2 family protein [Alphaproteobacteria bacterium]|nr:nuclear transport factor 2 family protein [Alphaproteobacteria bacterium]